MKTTDHTIKRNEDMARSVLECGSPLPLSQLRVSAARKSARGLAQSKTWRLLVAALLLSTLNLQLSTIFAQGTAFTYQGRLNSGGAPATGTYDLRFTIYDSTNSPGTLIAGPVTNAATAVSSGLFTVTLDFGAGVFTGAERWLEIGVRTNGGASPHTALAPRQAVTAAPYALHAANADTVAAVPWSSITGVPVTVMSNMLGSVGNEALELKVNGQRALRLEPTTNAPNLIGGHGGNFVSNGVIGATIAGGGAPGLANLVGANHGTVGGGIANAALGAQSVVAGGGHNVASGRSSFIGGGGGFDAAGGGPYPNLASGDWSTIGGGWLNNAWGNSSIIAGGALNESGTNAQFAATGGGVGNINLGYAATIAGGYYNRAENNSATVGGGEFNFASGVGTAIAGGASNTNLSPHATIAGGRANLVEPGADSSAIGGGEGNINLGYAATIAGGYYNRAENNSATVGGGEFNFASGVGTAIAGGASNTNLSPHATIAGGRANLVEPGADSSAIGGGEGNINVGYAATIAGGYYNRAENNSATVGGGEFNFASGVGTAIAGGASNTNLSPHATIAGGQQNTILSNAANATVGGGLGNVTGGRRSVIGGGSGNSITNGPLASTIGGGQGNHISSGQAYSTIAGGVNNLSANRSDRGFIGGGSFNTLGQFTFHGTIGGGQGNATFFNAQYPTLLGGLSNLVANSGSVIPGGLFNTNAGNISVISGGESNYIGFLADHSVIGGGAANRVVGSQLLDVYAIVGGGGGNTVQTNVSYSTISGGRANTIQANAHYAAIPGGFSNEVAGVYGFAAGRRAKANHPGAFVWADSTDTNFSSTATNEFSVRATGGVRLETGGAGVSVDGLGVLAGSVSANQIADGAVTSAKIADGTIVNLDISASAAIADTKLATISTAGKVANSALSSSVSLLGQTIESAEITDGTIVPADLDLTAFNPTFWRTTGNGGTTPGTQFVGTTDNQPLTLKVNGVTALRIDPTATAPNIVGGLAGFRPTVIGTNVRGAVVAGGNAPAGPVSGVGVGDFHAVFDSDGAIGGGFGNKVGTDNGNPNDAPFATVAGGVFNGAAGYAATVAGGDGNFADGLRSSIGGGAANRASGAHSTISGGLNNLAAGATSFAAGNQAKANHQGSFVWADSQLADFASTTSNQFSIRASGGVQLNTDTSMFFGDQTRQMLNLWNNAFGIGVQTDTLYQRSNDRFSWFKGGTHSDNENDPGAGGIQLMTIDGNGEFHVGGGIFAGLSLQNRGTPNFVGNPTAGERYVWFVSQGVCRLWSGNEKMSVDNAGIVTAFMFNPTSDRNAKENFEPINSREVLEKVAALPITRWNFKQDTTSDHIGPMAQDFHAAFGTGADDKHIATVDADGVALAAIQGLNQKVEEKGAAIQDLNQRLRSKDEEIQELKRRLAALEQLVLSFSVKDQ